MNNKVYLFVPIIVYLTIFHKCALDISNKHEWDNCFIKNAQKKCQEFFPTLFVKATDFQLVFNFEQTSTVTIFGEHVIMAHMP